MPNPRDPPSTFRRVHRLVEHYTPDGALGRTLLGAVSLTAFVPLFFGGLSALTNAFGLLPFLAGGIATILGLFALPLGLFVLWPVYLSLIGNVDTAAAYPEGAAKPDDADDAVELLKRRYATGELDRTEFQRRLNDIIDDGGSELRSDRASSETTQRETVVDRGRE